MRSVFMRRILAVTVIVVGIAGCSGSHPAASASRTAQPAHATQQPFVTFVIKAHG